jgi:hypothetical protein
VRLLEEGAIASVVRSPRGAALSARNETGDGRFHAHSSGAFAGPVCDPPVAHPRQTFAAKFLHIIRGVAAAVLAWVLFTERGARERRHRRE